MPSTLRILDANLNRAREAMRVMEDIARFALDDGALAAGVKTLRHDLRSAAGSLALAEGAIEFNRETPGDAGTSHTTPGERRREGLVDVALAAGKRLGEALRVLEETGKTLDPEFAAAIKPLRYRGYDLESRLLLRLGTGRARQWTLCVLLTRSLCRRPWTHVLQGAIDGGADCIQVREKEIDGGELARHVREVIAVARPRGVSVIVNDRVDVALAAGADGVHLGQHDLSVREARRICGRELLIGVSTHDLAEADAAVAAGADSCGVGAMFSTSLKAERIPSGIAYLKAFIERHPATPHLAIGGVTPANVGRLAEAGARGVAASSAVCGADDPEQAARELAAAFAASKPIPIRA